MHFWRLATGSGGCYCQVNTALKGHISSLYRNFDYIMIDGEAGIKQVNRRVMESVTTLVLVSDLSRKGLTVARSISDVAESVMQCERKGLIINKLQPGDSLELPPDLPLQLFATLPDDERIRQADIRGNNLLTLNQSPACSQLRKSMSRILGLKA